MTERWQVCTEVEFYNGDPGYAKDPPLWVVYDAGEDDPPLAYCDSEYEARTVADALNAVQRVRDVLDWYSTERFEHDFLLNAPFHALRVALSRALDGETDES